MVAGQLILIGGGVRSGKSDFALSLARQLGQRRLFLATAQAGDDEMTDRIRRHRQARGDDFITIEEPLAIAEAVRRHAEFDVVVLDCLTLWLSNLLLNGCSLEQILQHVDDFLAVLGKQTGHVVIITNEVGMGIVPENALGRQFRDVAGLAHQRISQAADEVYLAVLGTILRIKPPMLGEPVA
ncbi:MAG TPA: bifunctional adenosylcobinamide kinase/adenosylcobinamide-phosphate guanylyltransferase [Gemmataceae bacterium]|nr:bifunctional adenosylcobinamide kinase/adenosylcobinamide-phosphate guanylyltransferase [Gemmataceae bacterium]